MFLESSGWPCDKKFVTPGGRIFHKASAVDAIQETMPHDMRVGIEEDAKQPSIFPVE